ncbi:MAG: hypothetical protein AAF456_25105, partial [Planctomycetota bacterium]
MSELDLLLENALLRDQIEPYADESVTMVDLDNMSIRRENEYLSSILAWERAPVLPICQWFEPELQLAEHRTLDDIQLNQKLHQVIGRLYERNIMLISTGHLSDRQLYCLIARDILPAQEKKVVLPGKYIRWQCLDEVTDEESWLRFYASPEEREKWSFENGVALPPRERMPFPRIMPQ